MLPRFLESARLVGMDSAEFRRRRARLGLTQEALARRLGVSRQSVYNWERASADGRPRRLQLGAVLALALTALACERGHDDDDDSAADRPH